MMSIGLFRGNMKKIVLIAAALIAIFCTRGTAQLMTECCGDCHVIHAWEDVTEREWAAERAAKSAAAIAKGPTGAVRICPGRSL